MIGAYSTAGVGGENYATVKVSRKGARYLVDDGREAVAGETVERREATQKIKVILQNNIGRGV